MKQETFNVLFFLKKKRVKVNGEALIYVRITVNGHSFEISVKRSAPIKHWGQAKGKLRGKNKISTEINLFIETIRTKIYNTHRELEADNKEINIKTFRNRYFGIDEERKTLLQAFNEHNKEAKSLIGKGYVFTTVQRFETTARYLEEFLKSEYKLSDIPLKELHLYFIRKFDIF